MQRIFLSFICVLCSVFLIAQVPQKFSYQGIARDLSGNPLPNQSIGLQISILESSANGTEVYQETHVVTTSNLGLFNVQIGGGTVVSGEFEDINWEDEDHFIRIEMDENGGSNYQLLGTSQLLSVPYALHAGNGSHWNENGGDLNYTDGSVVIGNDQVNPSALLELSSSDKGLLLPRVELVESSDASPLQSHVEGMVVYNTATINDVCPGYYINDGTKWIGMQKALDIIEDLEDSVDELERQIPIKRAVIIAGQSNTTWGAGQAVIPDFSGKGLSQLGRLDVNLQVVPLTFYGTYQNSRNVNGGSFGSIFLYHYYNQLKNDYPNRDIQLLLIPAGAGASGWAASQYPGNSWRTDASYLSDMVTRIKWAKSNGYQIDAFLWHQGETDAISQTVNYKDIVKNFIRSMRDYAGNEKLPFILGEMVYSWVASNPLFGPYQEILNEISTEVPYTKTVNASGLTLADAIHFDAQAHVELGQRYFDQYLEAINNDAPSNYTPPSNGEYLVYNFDSSNGLVFPDIFSAIHFGDNPTDTRYSRLGDIWKYKNEDGYYHFKLEVVNGNGVNGGVFEWKQKINPFGLSEQNFEDKSGSIILNNTIGLNTTGGQGFSSLAYDSPVNSGSFTTLFHADTRASLNFWWFPIGQVANFGNRIPLLESNDTVTHVRLYCVKE